MKYFVFVLLFIVNGLLFGQTKDSVPEIYFLNKPVYYERGEVKSFEKKEIYPAYREKMIKGKVYFLAIQNLNSGTRFLKGSSPRFFVKVSPGVDPDDEVLLFSAADEKVALKAKYRMFILGYRRPYESFVQENTLPRTFKRVGVDTYEIVPDVLTLPGEYSLVVMTKERLSSIAAEQPSQPLVSLFCFALE
jgi:hypothetical protein